MFPLSTQKSPNGITFSFGDRFTVPQISRAQGQFVKSDKIAKKLSKMLIWASKIKF